MIKAIIFDMDGVLVDSEIEYIRIYKQFFEEYGAPLAIEELYFLAGSPHNVEFDLICKRLNVGLDEAYRLQKEFFSRYKIDYSSIKKNYVDEILTYLADLNITISLASSSKMENIKTVLKQCAIESYFSLLVSGEMFEKSKPNPEIYEYTVKQLCVPKEDVLVVEDSNYGIEAAKAAGLKTVALIDPVLNFDNKMADYKIDSLKDIKKILEDM